MHWHCHKRFVVEANITGIGFNKTDDHVKAGGFACAIRAQQTDDFTSADLQRHVLHDGPTAIGFGEMMCAKGASHRKHHCAGFRVESQLQPDRSLRRQVCLPP